MRKLLFIALLLTACGKKKDAPATPEPGSASGTSGAGGSSAATPPPTPKPATDNGGAGTGSAPAAAAGSGCKLPDELAAGFTITKGCTVKVDGSIKIPETVTLTIEEGAKLQMAKGTHLEVNGGLVVKGTDAAPVVFTSADPSPNPGDWEGIVFKETTVANTSIDHAKIEYGGGHGPWGETVIHLLDGISPKRIAITNTEITHSAGPALGIDDVKTIPVKLENNTFSDDSKTCIAAPADVWGAIGVNKCGDQLAHVTKGTLTKTATWPKLDTAYVLDNTLDITGPDVPILTLPEGATVKLVKGAAIHIGADGGGLVASKVTFTSAEAIPDAGDWGGFAIDAKSTGTKIDGCTIEFAGGNFPWGNAPIVIMPPVDKIASRVTITNTTIRKSNNAGIDAPDGKCGPYGEAASGNKVEGAPSVCLKK